MWVKGSDEHERVVQKIVYTLSVDLDTVDAVHSEGVTGIADHSCGVDHVLNYEWFEHVEFEMSIGVTDGNGHVVSHYLCADHGDCFALSGVYLTRHYARTWFVLWEFKFAKSTAWTRS